MAVDPSWSTVEVTEDVAEVVAEDISLEVAGDVAVEVAKDVAVSVVAVAAWFPISVSRAVWRALWTTSSTIDCMLLPVGCCGLPGPQGWKRFVATGPQLALSFRGETSCCR